MKKFPKIIPIFHLSNFIIFPKTSVPLNIFEQRYIEVVDESMKTNKLIGMIQPKNSYNPTSRNLYNVGCLGKIISFKETEDKRYLIELKGIARFEIIKEIKSEKKYRECEIDFNRLKIVTEQCELTKLISKLPEGFDTNLGDRGIVISGGELQRIGIARALYKKSEILVLDEFTSALDDENELKLIRILKKLSDNKTIIISSHKKNLFNLCDSVFLIEDKKIFNINE